MTRITLNNADWHRQFIDALRARGLQLRRGHNLEPDGQLHRLDVIDQRAGNQNGSYVLHLNPIPCGAFTNWTDGQGFAKWRADLPNQRGLTLAEQREIDQAIERARTQNERERATTQAEARVKARRMWKKAVAASASYDYCQRKQVKPYGLRVYHFKNGDDTLLVPMRDEEGKIQSLQLIHPNGDKHFLSGGRAAGGRYWVCHPDDAKDPDKICICEGWATGESIYQATGYAVLMAFYCENLHEIAQWAHEQYPDAEIIICADDDWQTEEQRGSNPGRECANKAARAIDARVAVPEFGDERTDAHGSVRTDFNDMHAVVGDKAVKRCIDSASEPSPEDTEEDDNAKKNKETQASTLLGLAPDGLFHTKDQIGYADIVVNGHRETWRIRSTTFKHWLVNQYFLKAQQAPGSEAVRQAIEMLEARALFGEGTSEREVFVRVGGHDGNIYLDLCDKEWRAVEITPNGWQVISNPPVRFCRTKGMLPLPEPQRGGSIADLRPFVNVKTDGEEKQITDTDFVLFVAWLLAALRDCGPYPILKVWAEPGSAKSTLTVVSRRLTDPHKIPKRRLPSEDRNLFIAAGNTWLLSYDNVSHIPQWLSDSLCSLATGGGYATRALFTDQDEQLFEATRPVILNAVENFVVRHDLADRTIVLELPFIPPSERQRERDFWTRFEAKCPQILGALLDVVAHGLKMLPEVAEEDWPRMADFAHWITACEGALWDAGTFRKAYRANRRKLTLSAIEDDPVATALRSLVKPDEPEWHGTTAELLEDLTKLVSDKQSKSKDWPQTARALTGHLQKAKGSLRRVGITVKQDRQRTNKGRMLTVTLATKYGRDRHNRHNSLFNRDYNNLNGDGRGDGDDVTVVTVDSEPFRNPRLKRAKSRED